MNNEASGLPERSAAPDSPRKQILKFLGSMQLGIILLLLLAVISVYATLRPMQEAIRYVYTSWWFIGIMSFTALNLLLCTVGRIGFLYRQAFRPSLQLSAEEIKKMPVSRLIKMNKIEADPLSGAKAAFKANGLSVRLVDSPGGPLLFGEKGRVGYFGSVVTHLSLLLILFGAAYGALTGFETQGGGMSGDTFFVREGNFHVNIREVKMEYLDEEGRVRPRAKSNIVVTRRGQEIGRQLVSINLPLRFEGIAIYHSTFLWVAHLTITDPQTGRSTGPVKLLPVRELFAEDILPGGRLENLQRRLPPNTYYFMKDKGIYILARQFVPDFLTISPERGLVTRSHKPNRPVLSFYILVEGGPTPRWNLLELGVPKVVETVAGPVQLELSGFENAAMYSVAKNLGRPYLFAGALLLLAGMYLSFFLVPRRFYALFDGNSSTLTVGGRGYRNKLLIEQVMERIESYLQPKEGNKDAGFN